MFSVSSTHLAVLLLLLCLRHLCVLLTFCSTDCAGLSPPLRWVVRPDTATALTASSTHMTSRIDGRMVGTEIGVQSTYPALLWNSVPLGQSRSNSADHGTALKTLGFASRSRARNKRKKHTCCSEKQVCTRLTWYLSHASSPNQVGHASFAHASTLTTPCAIRARFYGQTQKAANKRKPEAR
jgi:hypothetical protein